MGIDLAFKIFSIAMINLALFVVIQTVLIVDYTMLVLNKIIIFSSIKIRAWLQLNHTHNVGVVAPEAPLVKIFEITTAYSLHFLLSSFMCSNTTH